MQIDNATGVNDIVDKFSDILYTAGNKSLRKKKVKNGKFKKNKKWFDLDLMKMMKTLDSKGRLYAKNPNDPMIRGNFLNTERFTVSCVN